MPHVRSFALVALVSLVSLLTGCGGSGGGSAPEAGPVAAAQLSLVAGTLADGQGGTSTAMVTIPPGGPFALHGSRIAADALGNVLIADDFQLLNLSPANVLTTVGGWSRDVAIDAAGTWYVAAFPDSQGILIANVAKRTASRLWETLPGTIDHTSDPDNLSPLVKFDGPLSVAADRNGNVYVGDVSNVIMKVTPAGVVTPLAGTRWSSGSADGMGAAARFNSPQALAVDGAGNVYVADTGNSAIRKITPEGAVTTLAGTAGSTGFADGVGTAARFAAPNALLVDAAGNVVVADGGNFLIRKITPAGAVSTIVGQPGTSNTRLGALPASLGYPSGIALSGSGLLIMSGQTLLRADYP
jgi:hypothetical protein